MRNNALSWLKYIALNQWTVQVASALLILVGCLVLLSWSLDIIAIALLLGSIGWSVARLNRLEIDRLRSEDWMRSSQERLQLALRGAGQGIWDWDKKTQVLTWDDRCKEIFGLPPDFPITYEWHLEALHPDDRQRVRDAATAALRDRTEFCEEYRTCHPDGKMVWVLARGCGYYNEAGEAYRMSGTVLDISDRKRRELNDRFLSQLDLRLRQLSDAEAMAWEVVSSLGEYLKVDRCLWHEIDWEHRSTTVKRTWHREDVSDVTGTYALDEYFTPDQLSYFAGGQTLIVGDVTVHPATAPHAQRYLPLGAAAFVSIPCIHSGCWVAVLAVNAKTARQWREDEVALMQEIVARLWSVIEHTRAIQALRERENRYRTLFETVDRGFCICEMLLDENGVPRDYRFLEINPAFEKMTGLEQAAGKTALELLPNLESFWIETYGKVALTGEPARFENGSEVMDRWFDVYACRIDEPQNYRFAIVFTNITDRKRSEAERARLLNQTQAACEQAQTANRLKDEFLAALSHELRTPLNPIMGWTKLLQRGNLTPAKTSEALAIIERNLKQQIAIVDDLLDISSIIQGKFNFNVQPVDLVLVINAAIETVKFSAIAKSISLDLRILSNSSTRVMADENRLQQVFWNLLSNAVKFTPNGGRVEVQLSLTSGNESGAKDGVRSDYVEVQIIDNGIGIAPEFLPYVFDRFRQADGSYTRKYGGLGLGLAIVKQSIELQGGTVKVESPGIGQGAVFTVRLPLLLESVAARDFPKQTMRDRLQTVTENEASLAGLRILIVDDDADNLELLGFFLEQQGVAIVAVNSGQAALDSVARSVPDILISDIGMPQMNGYELLRQIRELPSQQNTQIPAIALTAFADREDEARAIGAGFQAYLSKPVNPIELVSAIEQQIHPI
ncbi:MAG: ATP-binding protein [Microcoleus sp.]